MMVASLLLLSAAVTAAPPVQLEYTVVRSGAEAGTMTVVGDPATERRVAYRYLDRGRGPNTLTTYRVDKRSRPLSLRLENRNDPSAPPQEIFSSTATRARWESPAEVGEGRSAGLYLSVSAPPEYQAAIVRALLAAGGRMTLLPSGEVRLQRVQDHVVDSGTERRKLTLYRIEGTDFEPTFVWLDEHNEFFYSGNDWSAAIRKGWRSVQAELIDLQTKSDFANKVAVARTLQRKPQGMLAVRHARLFDAAARVMRPGWTVLVSGARIVAAGPDADVPVPADAEVVDATGKTLLPGLWDNHAHMHYDFFGVLDLAAGITSVRDLGMDMTENLERRANFDSGRLAGPRVHLAGLIDSPGPVQAPTKALVSTADELRGWIRKYHDAGYVQIKLYTSIKPELVPIAAQTAHGLGMRLSGHVPTGLSLEQAVKSGYDEINHAAAWFYNFEPPAVVAGGDPRQSAGAVAEHARLLDLGSPDVARFVGLLKARHTVLDPTINLYERNYLSKRREPSPGFRTIADRLPPTIRRSFVMSAGSAPDDAARGRYAESFAKMKAMTKKLFDAGVTILPGTDSLPGFSYHRELELYAEAGIPNLDVLHLATLRSAEVHRRDGDLGSIAPGKLADLVLVDGDPSQRMSDIRKTAWVMKDGVVMDPAKLYASIGVGPAR